MRQVFLMLAALVVAGCGRDYPQETRDNFMNSCTDSDSRESCKCSLEAIEDLYEHGEFLRIEQDVLRGKPIPTKMQEAVLDCKARN